MTLARFRPNLVLAGIDAHAEDQLDEIVFADAPTARSGSSSSSRASAARSPTSTRRAAVAGHAVGDVLAQYRADPRMGGALTFAMNAVIVEGIGRTLAAGMRGTASYAFA